MNSTNLQQYKHYGVIMTEIATDTVRPHQEKQNYAK